MAEPENETSPQGTNAMPVNRMPDGELLARTKQWFQENTDGASIAAAGEVIAVAYRLEARVEQLKNALKHYADAENWHAYDEGGYFTDDVVWMGIYGNNEGTFPAGPDLALVAIAELKKEEESDGES